MRQLPSWRNWRLERELRLGRIEPRPEFVDALSRKVAPKPRSTFLRPVRLALVAMLTAAVLAAFASVGGLAYAASQTAAAVGLVKRAASPQKSPKPRVRDQSPAQDQYRPGCGLGDKNHVHTGPPGRGGVCPARR